ncbi:MAG: hypothetical protein HC869_10765 [Rhodospirillales bacterium]|nr:hypothetical protein [Rhodospirillales bacterium]
MAEIEARVVAALKSYLLAPDLVAEAVEAYRIERSRLAKGGRSSAGMRSVILRQ